jgi:hypothetical protein
MSCFFHNLRYLDIAANIMAIAAIVPDMFKALNICGDMGFTGVLSKKQPMKIIDAATKVEKVRK